jgi:hypothetical protein
MARSPNWALEQLQKIQKLRDWYAEEHAQKLARPAAKERLFPFLYEHPPSREGRGEGVQRAG